MEGHIQWRPDVLQHSCQELPVQQYLGRQAACWHLAMGIGDFLHRLDQ